MSAVCRVRVNERKEEDKWTAEVLDWRDKRWHGGTIRRQIVSREITQAREGRNGGADASLMRPGQKAFETKCKGGLTRERSARRRRQGDPVSEIFAKRSQRSDGGSVDIEGEGGSESERRQELLNRGQLHGG